MSQHILKETGPGVEVGGYFGLELPSFPDYFSDTIKYQSARATIRAVLEACKATKVFIPAYVCSTVIQAAMDAGSKVELYDLDEALLPKVSGKSLADDCYFLYVNYFGLCDEQVARLASLVHPGRLIIDNSHALFSRPENVMASVYSPRKFVGVPDGGLLRGSVDLEMVPPTEEDRGSTNRMTHLLKRLAYSARDGYVDFDKARLSLRDNRPLGMSRLTRRLMNSIHWDSVRALRHENFKTMDSILGLRNQMKWGLKEAAAPLCYPLVLQEINLPQVKASLAAKNIFVPTYWEDALPRITPKSTEWLLIHNTLFLPCDQRMDYNLVRFVSNAVLQLVDGA